MKKIVAALALAVLAGLGIAAPPAVADDAGLVRETSIKSLSFHVEDGRLCHNVKVVANGETLVEDVSCQP